MATAVERRVGAGTILLSCGSGVVFAALFFGDGISSSRLVWIGAAALAALLLGLALRGFPRLGRWQLASVVSAVAFVAWNGLSLVWSIAPDRSWDAFNRCLVYLAFVALGLLAGRRPRALAGTGALLLGLVVGWGLLAKVVPALGAGDSRFARLATPVGYWNGLALLADLAVPLGLWLAARREHRPAVRAAGALLVYGALVVCVLTYSRAGVAAAAVAAVLWLLVGGAAFESLAALALAAPLAAAASAIAFALPGVHSDAQPYSARVADGAWFGIAVVGLGALLVVLALAAVRLEDRAGDEPRRRLTRAAALVLAAALAAGLAVSAVNWSGWAREFRGSGATYVSQGDQRLGTLSSNNRWAWWQEAWRIFTRHPVDGTGAGSFQIARQPYRANELVTLEPHNLALQFLADLGVVGLVLATAAAAAAAVGIGRGLRRLPPAERSAATAVALALPVYALLSLVDFHWDFVAVSAPVAVAFGASLAFGAPAREPARRLALAPAGALAAGVVCSLVLPWLAARRVDASLSAVVRGDIPGAIADARAANDLNPFSIAPLQRWAFAEEVRRNVPAAIRLYERAAVLQPSNAAGWYELGAYELRVGRLRRAWRDLNWAYGLDPHGPAGAPDGPLAQTRKLLFG